MSAIVRNLRKGVARLTGRSTMKQVTAVVIGAGQRGTNYAAYAQDFPNKLKVVGVVEPRDVHRRKMSEKHGIPEDRQFKDLADFLALGKIADCVFVCTPDRMHKEPAVACAKLGYDILLEKPMAPTLEECEEIVSVCEENNVVLAVCHVLRYTPQACTIQRLIENGSIGDLVNIQLLEPVGHWHFAHSYVRGNWHKEGKSSFSLLAKSCHDLDLLQYWSKGQKCCSISSFGSLKHFTTENKPKGASSRCLDCKVEESCPYSAKRIYLNQSPHHWPVSVITDIPDIESVTEALKTGPYGKCVYDCDNDVMDNQVVSMQFEGGATATFSMVAFTKKICARQARIFGTMGELSCDFDNLLVVQNDFKTGKTIRHDLHEQGECLAGTQLSGHGGADFHAMEAFITAIATGDRSMILTGPADTLYSHKLCFMAEKARKENIVVNM